MFLGVKTKTDTLGFHMRSSVSTIIQCSKRVQHVFDLICNVLCFFCSLLNLLRLSSISSRAWATVSSLYQAVIFLISTETWL